METIQEQLRKFNVSDKTGFLMENPLVKLPEYFEAWNSTATQMPDLVATKNMRDAVSKLKILDHTRLSSYREYRLAHLQLSIIASGYIWQDGDKGVTNVLPECIAVPWCAVAEYLGMQPVICHPSLALANWRWSEEENCMKSLYTLPGGSEADWFLSVTCQVEIDFAPALPCILMAMDNAEQGNVDELIENLNCLTNIVCKMKKSVSTLHDRLTASTFYNTIRPFFSGWGDKDSPLPNGLIYEGVSNKPKKMIGGSAAQSSILHCMDAILGVHHKRETEHFLNEMKTYMTPSNREFIDWIENRSKVYHFVTSQSDEQLSIAYNACVQSVVDFRSYHIQIVTKYIVMMGNKSDRKMDFESLASKGTGGSDLLPFLKTLRSSTSDCLTSKQGDVTKG